MVFSSPVFLFLFLPIVLFLTFISPGIKVKNIVLLIASLLFYSWGEPDLVLLMIIMIGINYFVGLKIGSSVLSKQKRTFLIIGIVLNLLSLGYFKYTNFFIDNLNTILSQFSAPPITINEIRLPIGISFFTFQSLSYLVDVYRNDAKVQKNPLYLGLYISLFPQLIAGPIVRYHDIFNQIIDRKTSFSLFHSGIKRFIEGLAKKVLIANSVGYFVDQIFDIPPDQLSSLTLVWGALLYSLQIFFDFSGYSDMAIGLGRMFGFRFLENFNFPYIATSIKDFWRRWHISLSTWFRDYLYIPLGGNRVSTRRNFINLIIVFLITGLWHGASWSFVLWGLFHGAFLILEKTKVATSFARVPKLVKHVYVILVFGIGWILFRAENLGYFAEYIKSMLTINSESDYKIKYFMNLEVVISTVLGICFSRPTPKLKSFVENNLVVETVVYLSLFLISIIWLSAGTYNPFIYFQF